MSARQRADFVRLQQAASAFKPGTLILIADELARRNANRASLLLPGRAFAELLTPARIKVFHGGRGSAKSMSVAEYYVRKARGEYRHIFGPKRHRFLCCREYQNSITESVHRLLVDTIERLGARSAFEITATSIRCPATRAEFFFKGLHESKVSSVRSVEAVTDCWLEEGQFITKESLATLEPTIRADDSEIVVTMNVMYETDAAHEVFIANPPPEAIVRQVNFDQNPYFPAVLEELRQRYLREIAEAQDDDERAQAQADYDHVWLGMPKRISHEIILSGKTVLMEFDDELWRQAGRLFYGVDFGFAQDPMAVLRSFILDNDLYISHEAYGTGVEIDGERDSQGRGEMERFMDSVPGIRDWAIKADSARPELISFLAGLGFNITAAEKWDGSVEDGIAHLRGFRRIFIHPRCRHTDRESRLWKYKVDKMTGQVLPIVIDKANHTWDGQRYALDGYIQRRGAVGIWEKLGRAA